MHQSVPRRKLSLEGQDLFNVDGNFDFWDIFGDVPFQRWNIDRLPHDTGHCELCRVITEDEAGEAVILGGLCGRRSRGTNLGLG